MTKPLCHTCAKVIEESGLYDIKEIGTLAVSAHAKECYACKKRAFAAYKWEKKKCNI